MVSQFRRLPVFAGLLLALLSLCHPASRAEEGVPPALRNVGIDATLGSTIPANLSFIDENGKSVPLASFFNKDKPVILALVYYECPMLCTLTLNGLTSGLQGLPWTPGNQFEVLTISFNPAETPELAKAKKASYLREFNRPGADRGWHFMTGKEDQIKPLASALGFKYFWDPAQKQFAHAAGLYIFSPQGKLTRVLYGIDFPARDLRLALTEAAQGKVGTITDKIMLFCYHYDPQKKGYTFAAFRVMQVAGILTVVVLATVVGAFLWSERRQRRRAAALAAAAQTEPTNPTVTQPAEPEQKDENP